MDDDHKSTVAYKYDLNAGFDEVYRFADDKPRAGSPPVALPNASAAVGAGTRLKYLNRGLEVPWFEGGLTNAPTRLADGRIVTIERSGDMSVLNKDVVQVQQFVGGRSHAAAAASCTHVYVAHENELVTYDASTMQPLVRMPWADGGFHAPVIGPQGHLYGMTRHGLFVFPPPQTVTPAQRFACGVSTTPNMTIGPK